MRFVQFLFFRHALGPNGAGKTTLFKSAKEYGMLRLQAITVLVVISGEILRCTRISSRQYFAAPSIEIGYPSPFAAITPAFVPRLLVKAICNFEKSFPNQLASSL